MLTVNAKMEAGQFQAGPDPGRRSSGIEGPRLRYER